MACFDALLIRLDAIDERLDARRTKAAAGQLDLFGGKGVKCGDGWIRPDYDCHKSEGAATGPSWKPQIDQLGAAAELVLRKYQDRLAGYYTKVSELEVAHTKATGDLIAAEGPGKRLKAKKRLRDVTDMVRDNEYELIGVMEEIMNDMKKSNLGERELLVLPQKVNFSDWGSATGEPKGHLRNFARMFNGKGLKEHNGVQGVFRVSPAEDGARPYNRLGHVVTVKNIESLMFHELMHTVEHQRPWMAEFARDWASSRAYDESSPQMPANLKGYSVGTPKGKPLYQLGAITGNSQFRPEEGAWVDDYVTPYMGKYYSKPVSAPASTEVWTTAAEHFNHPLTMAKFYKKHPDIFKLMVGLSQSTD